MIDVPKLLCQLEWITNSDIYSNTQNEDLLLFLVLSRYPGTGEYDKLFQEGVYSCAGCGTPLYKSTTKFNSGCGWPAFFEGLPGAINRHVSFVLMLLFLQYFCILLELYQQFKSYINLIKLMSVTTSRTPMEGGLK